MAVRSREEILTQLEALVGDATTDDAINLIEDITDTLANVEGNSDGTDWKAEAERIDKEWREKYVQRFMSSEPNDDNREPEEEPKKSYTYDNLFKAKED